ncbi:hypothetical protein Goe9_c01970 [Bacillus phage vB_BsuM-Goe9]|nr:hypothetical protein Goe9_c01970 [Bacillus phage vB_BsuM-Goe9]WIT25929.1 hypothetical protein [Bacillus phage SPO1L1]WIT26127.1 hypothetical protein [Bacillus phage SPO1L2]
MTKFRKKPIEVEAVEFKGWNSKQQVEFSDRPEWLNEAIGKEILFFGEPRTLTIKTLEGSMIANKGDFIIKGVKGELYPCKPDIFHKTYEEVDS